MFLTQPEVCELNVALWIKKYVFWFQISEIRKDRAIMKVSRKIQTAGNPYTRIIKLSMKNYPWINLVYSIFSYVDLWFLTSDKPLKYHQNMKSSKDGPKHKYRSYPHFSDLFGFQNNYIEKCKLPINYPLSMEMFQC